MQAKLNKVKARKAADLENLSVCLTVCPSSAPSTKKAKALAFNRFSF